MTQTLQPRCRQQFPNDGLFARACSPLRAEWPLVIWNMADPTPPDGTIAALLRQLNALIAEAQRLREKLEKAPRTPDMGEKVDPIAMHPRPTVLHLNFNAEYLEMYREGLESRGFNVNVALD